MGSNEATSTNHVLLLAFPFGTHAAPLHALARSLAAAAPRALFSFVGSDKCNAPLAALPSPPNLSLYAVSDGCPEGFYSPDPSQEVAHFLRACPGNLLEGVDRAVRDSGGVAVSCVLSDCFLPFAGELAAEIGVPWVTLWTAGASSLSTHVCTDEIRGIVGVDSDVVSQKLDQILDFIPSLSAIRVRDLPEGVVFGDLETAFHRLLHRMGRELPRAAAVALNTSGALETAVLADLSARLPCCLPVGPLNLLLPAPTVRDPSGCLPWLDAQPTSSVVYVAFGTVLSPPAAELAALAEALEASGAPFLWSLREKARAQLPLGFVERNAGKGTVVEWAPQAEVLRHKAVGAFVTHCGWNSVTEGVAGGVAMVCRPFFGDQRMNARLVSDVWRVGVGVDGVALTREGTEAALRQVLWSEEGREMRRRAAAIGDQVEKALGASGSSVHGLKELLQVVCRN